jgi:hypothetical protein
VGKTLNKNPQITAQLSTFILRYGSKGSFYDSKLLFSFMSEFNHTILVGERSLNSGLTKQK